MFEFHKDKKRYFEIQMRVTSEDIIPFLEAHGVGCTGKQILEIGCGEAGVLNAFIQNGNKGVGVELYASRVDHARQFLEKEISSGLVQIVNKNIFDIQDPAAEFGRLFDIIILKDVIEHIPDQARFINKLGDFLAAGGVVFFAYPPWFMPFGGHQQICRSRFLQFLPWIHLLPWPVYRFVLGLFGESEATISELRDIKSTGINTGKMLRTINNCNFIIIGQEYWLINPIYKLKFGLRKRRVPSWLAGIPVLRNFFTTAHYVLFTRTRDNKGFTT